MENKKKIPEFKTEAQEQKFWTQHDSTEYLDWSKAKKASFPNLKPSVKTISLRIPEDLLNNIKIIANKNDVPYQSLMKVFLSERIAEERKQYCA